MASSAGHVTRPAKTRRGKRAREARAPLLHENTKTAMLLRAARSGQVMNAVLGDLHALKKPDAVQLHKPLEKRPFEDETSIEFLGQKTDSSLFAYASHSKKRPHNLVIGRLFDGRLLDMAELGVDNYKGLADFKTQKNAVGSKPCFVFQGDAFASDPDLALLKSLLLGAPDFFRGAEAVEINLAGLDHVIACTAVPGEERRVLFRHHRVTLLAGTGQLPTVALEEMGPTMDLTLRRVRHADPDLRKMALTKPKVAKPKKNVSYVPSMGHRVGRIHMKSQELEKVALRKMKGLRAKRRRGETGDAEE